MSSRRRSSKKSKRSATKVPTQKNGKQLQSETPLSQREKEVIAIIQQSTPDVSSNERNSHLFDKLGARNVIFTRSQLASETLLSKAAALARIRRPVPDFIDGDFKQQLKEMKFDNVANNPGAFEAYKQIALLFGSPQVPNETNSSLTWNIPTFVGSLPISPFGLISKKTPWLRDGVIERIRFSAPSESSFSTTMVIPFPQMSNYVWRHLQLFMAGLTYDSSKQLLSVTSETLYESWVKAGLISLVCSYHIDLAEIRTGKPERRFLQGLGEEILQDDILSELMNAMDWIQKNGQRLHVGPASSVTSLFDQKAQEILERDNDIFPNGVLNTEEPEIFNPVDQEARQELLTNVDGVSLLKDLNIRS